MLVWWLNLAWKSGDPNQCLRLGDDAKTDRTLCARFRQSASFGSALNTWPLGTERVDGNPAMVAGASTGRCE
jgi:hypothetical protein